MCVSHVVNLLVADNDRFFVNHVHQIALSDYACSVLPLLLSLYLSTHLFTEYFASTGPHLPKDALGVVLPRCTKTPECK